jgi:hypothetical protein
MPPPPTLILWRLLSRCCQVAKDVRRDVAGAIRCCQPAIVAEKPVWSASSTIMPWSRSCREGKCHLIKSTYANSPSYIQSLVKSLQRLKELKVAKLASQLSANALDRPTARLDLVPVEGLESATRAVQTITADLQPTKPENSPSSDNNMICGSHFPVATPRGPDLRYFGASSVFALAVATMSRSRSDPTYTLKALQRSSLANVEPSEFHGSCNCTVTKRMVEKSVDLFMASIHPIYPFLRPEMVASDLEAYWEIEKSSADPETLRGPDAHRYFRIKIIAAIASASRSRHDASRIACDHGCYLEATKCVAKVTSEVSADSLRALMLLIIYCLFRPRKGDIWKLLDYACRLCLELGYNREPDIHLPVPQQEQQRFTFWSLYTIERIVGQLFGRPSDLPESMITTENPMSTLPACLDDDASSHQILQTCHHYRLVYLRSAIFSDVYLMSNEPFERDLIYYQDRLPKILDWYQQSREDISVAITVSSLTCAVAFHSTILFLFQPLVMDALSRSRTAQCSTATATPSQSSYRIPAEVFTSACRLIELYEEVLRAPRESVLGQYPITFMSAHYIFMASLMVMAYCMLYTDGSVSFPSVIGDSCPAYVADTSHIHLKNVLQISNSCLILLTFCAEKWPGMGGMRDVYRQLSDQVLKQILRLGLE